MAVGNGNALTGGQSESENETLPKHGLVPTTSFNSEGQLSHSKKTIFGII